MNVTLGSVPKSRFRFTALPAALALFASGFAHAIPIDVSAGMPDGSNPVVGDEFETTISATIEAGATAIGGALRLVFDPEVLELLRVETNPALTGIATPSLAIDNVAGTASHIGFADLEGGTDSFTIATLFWRAKGLGQSQLDLEDAGLTVFRWAGLTSQQLVSALEPNFVDATLSVATPAVVPPPFEPPRSAPDPGPPAPPLDAASTALFISIISMVLDD